MDGMKGTEFAKVGDPATIFSYSDRHPGTVISVTDREIVVQEDTYTATKSVPIGANPEYVYTRNENGPKYTFKPVRSGHLKGWWYENGRRNGRRFTNKYRERYYDPSF